MKKRRTKDQVKHEAILKAASRMFLKNGYSKTSMDAIAKMARVTKQTIYSHYVSKDALFMHMLAELTQKHSPTADTLNIQPGVAVDQLLYEAGMAFMNMITHSEVLATTRLVISEIHNHPKLAQGYYEDGTQLTIRTMAQFLDRLCARGLLAIDDTANASSHFIAMLKGKYYLRTILGIKPVFDVIDKESHIREIVTAFLQIYSAKSPVLLRSIH